MREGEGWRPRAGQWPSGVHLLRASMAATPLDPAVETCLSSGEPRGSGETPSAGAGLSTPGSALSPGLGVPDRAPGTAPYPL